MDFPHQAGLPAWSQTWRSNSWVGDNLPVLLAIRKCVIPDFSWNIPKAWGSGEPARAEVTWAVHWASLKAFVTTGEYNGYTDLGVTWSRRPLPSEGSTSWPSFCILPVQRALGRKIGKPYSTSRNVRGSCGSVLVHLILAPSSPGIFSAPVPRSCCCLGVLMTVAYQLGAILPAWATSPLMSSTRCTVTWPQSWKETAHQVYLSGIPWPSVKIHPPLWFRGPRLLLWPHKSFYVRKIKWVMSGKKI